MRTIILAALLTVATAGQAGAWWQYAEWGFTPGQVMTASGGHAVPCRPEVAVCATPPGGLAPSHAVERLTMVGLPASASFAFDPAGKLVQTVVLFAEADRGLLTSLMQGVHGAPADEAAGVWRDERRGTIITVIPAGRGTMLLYRPAGR